MANNVRKEFELYEPMSRWLKRYLEEKYRTATILTIDSHARSLDRHLDAVGVLGQYQQTVGLDIQVDVLGLIKRGAETKLVFVEAKKTPLNLHDLGQLWAYCRLCDPAEALLLSSAGLGGLNKILNNLSRTDLLDFGNGSVIKKMQVAKWDIAKSAVDFTTLVPKLG